MGIDTSSGSKCALCPQTFLTVTCKFGYDLVYGTHLFKSVIMEAKMARLKVGSGLRHNHQHTSQLKSYYPIGYVRDQQLLISLWSQLLIQP